jgi:hypothetical protein
MEGRRGYASSGERSWFAAKRDQFKLRRIQNSLCRQAEVYGVDHAVLQRSTGRIEFDRGQKKLSFVNPEGVRLHVYELDGWQRHQGELRQAIREKGGGPAAEIAEVNLLELAQTLRWYGHE